LAKTAYHKIWGRMIMNDHGSETKDISTQRKTWMRENQNQKEKKTTTTPKVYLKETKQSMNM